MGCTAGGRLTVVAGAHSSLWKMAFAYLSRFAVLLRMLGGDEVECEKIPHR